MSADTLERIIPVTLTVCAALGLLTVVACVVAAVVGDLREIARGRE